MSKKNNDGGALIAGIILIILSLFTSFIGLKDYRHFNNLIQNGNTTEGKVIEIKKYGMVDSYPVIEFNDTKETRSFVSSLSLKRSYLEKIKIGDKTTIIFDTKDPNNAEIKEEVYAKRLGQKSFFIISAFFFLLGSSMLINLYLRSKKEN